MARIPILKYPHEMLRRQCRAIQTVDDDIRRLADDMVDTMKIADGVGLAAPQVGHSIQLLVADVHRDGSPPLKLANPRIVEQTGSIQLEEGCLSVPGVRAKVSRASEVVVRATGMDGKEQTISATELLAVCLQHEIDHLNGVLFFDHLSKLKRSRLLGKYKKQQAEMSVR